MSYSGLRPISARKWDERKARHLLNRAGFGVPRKRVHELVQLGPNGAVDSLLYYHGLRDLSPEPAELIPARAQYDIRMAAAGESESEQRKALMAHRRREREVIAGLQRWWFERIATTARPLEEKMTLFWHGHFATSAQKVQSSLANHLLNQVFRKHATGNFKVLTTEVGQSVCMLRYLDNNRNVRGKPNENWARELMELFTLGPGNYSEEDIKESARAFTGWSFTYQGFAYREEVHDFDDKAFMGKRGNLDGWDVIERIFEQPAAGAFLCRKLWNFFSHENPEDELIEGLAETFRAGNYDLRPVLRALFLSRAFYSEDAIESQVKSPVQFLVQLAHDLELDDPPYGAMVRFSAQLGQNLFYPPNVKGWEGGRAWVNANALMLRYNMPTNLLRSHSQRLSMASMATSGGQAASMMKGSMADGARPKLQDWFRATLESMPKAERQRIRKRLGEIESGNNRRRGFMQRVVNDRAMEQHWKPERLFSRLAFSTAGECAEALGRRYLRGSLSEDQRDVLVEVLNPGRPPEARLRIDQLTRVTMNATLHLLFSMAEYQLC